VNVLWNNEHLYSPQVVGKKIKNTNKQFKQTNKHTVQYTNKG